MCEQGRWGRWQEEPRSFPGLQQLWHTGGEKKAGRGGPAPARSTRASSWTLRLYQTLI